jgi:spore coat polysaccharide biosynthesis protein SpsF (cytidylyltransferase family)
VHAGFRGWRTGQRLLEATALCGRRGELQRVAPSGSDEPESSSRPASSERLPGKSCRRWRATDARRLLERLHTVAEAERIIVATSDRPQDAAVAEFAASAGVATFRGPLDDVLARFVGAADAYGLDALVRVSGDSPLLDPGLVSAALRLFAEGGWDLVTNVQLRTFPRGQSVETIAVAALRRVAADTQHPADREHVTPCLYANPGGPHRNYPVAASTDVSLRGHAGGLRDGRAHAAIDDAAAHRVRREGLAALHRESAEKPGDERLRVAVIGLGVGEQHVAGFNSPSVPRVAVRRGSAQCSRRARSSRGRIHEDPFALLARATSMS